MRGLPIRACIQVFGDTYKDARMAVHFLLLINIVKFSNRLPTENLVKFAIMKKVLVAFMAVFICSLSTLGQSLRVVQMGTSTIQKNTYEEGVRYLKEHVPLEVFPSGEYGCILESPSLMLVLKHAPNNKIKEVSFLCGLGMSYGIDNSLKEYGYVLKSSKKVQLGNGAYVPQNTYIKGNIKCLVQILDNDFKQIIFMK